MPERIIFFEYSLCPPITGISSIQIGFDLPFLGSLGIPIIFLRKKQSPREVDKDERDSLIEKRAVIAAFVSVWILLFVATIIPRFIVGLDGSIPVWSLAFINIGILLIVLFVYSIAVLVQYGWGGKGGE